MGLFDPAWMSKNEEKALAAVAAISDQQELASVVDSQKAYDSVRRAAFNRLTDQQLLGKVAFHIYDSEVYANALNSIDRIEVLESMERDVINSYPDARRADSDERRKMIHKRIKELESAAAEKAMEEAFQTLNTDEKRIAFIRQYAAQYNTSRCCVRVLKQIEDERNLLQLHDNLKGMTTETFKALLDRIEVENTLLDLIALLQNNMKSMTAETFNALLDRIGEESDLLELIVQPEYLYSFQLKSVLERLGYTPKRMYLEGYKNALSAYQVEKIASALTPEEIKTLPLTLATLVELKDNPNLENEVRKNADLTLVDELVARIREHQSEGESLFDLKWEAQWLRVLYSDNRWINKINACKGMVVESHADYPSACTYPHEDSPAAYFDPEKED